MTEKTSSPQNPFEHRDQLIRDRLHRMKAAANDILNMINIEMPDGGLDCDGTCDGCILEELGLINPLGSCLGTGGVGCNEIVNISEMNIPGEP